LFISLFLFNRVRVAVAKDEFEGLMEHATLKERTHIPFLIVANKKYQEGAIPSNTIAQLLELERHLVGRPWHLQATDVVAGEGVIEGFTWLTDFLVSAPIRVTS
jgi:signal recognition particle receptor subunit beta